MRYDPAMSDRSFASGPRHEPDVDCRIWPSRSGGRRARSHPMWCSLLIVTIMAVGVTRTAGADEPAALAKARTLYNSGDYEGAIDAAAVSQKLPEWADASALVIARSRLEQYRQRGNADDLAAARQALGTVHSTALMPRDQVDLLIGLGLSLYLGETYGASAELFDTALARTSLLGARDRLLVLDWWATSLDREAQSRPTDRRAPVYQRIVERMEEEIRREPGNPIANYWLAAATRGTGDIDGAWNSAIAAWVRSTMAPDSTERLRADLDRLMTQVLIPERSRAAVGRDPQEALAALRSQWDLIKEQWK